MLCCQLSAVLPWRRVVLVAGIQRVFACESKQMELTCASQWAISVRSAFYGRDDAAICPHATAASDLACSDPDILMKMRHYCNGFARCDLGVTVSALGDPCPKTSKYLNVEYTCVGEWRDRACGVTASAGVEQRIDG